MFTDRTYRNCHHPAAHQHGTPQGYRLDQCRCRACTIAFDTVSAAEKFPHEQISCEVAQTHLELLLSRGFTLHLVRQASRVSREDLNSILFRDPKIRRSTEARILSVTPDPLHYVPASAQYSAIGTTRRLQGLVAIGYSLGYLQRRLNTEHFNLLAHGGAQTVTADVARKVRGLYDELWGHPQTGAEADDARRTALEEGWVSPLSWDDDEIDNPRAKPLGVPSERHDAYPKLEDIEYMIRSGVSASEVVRRARYSSADSLERRLRRAQRGDLVTLLYSNGPV